MVHATGRSEMTAHSVQQPVLELSVPQTLKFHDFLVLESRMHGGRMYRGNSEEMLLSFSKGRRVNGGGPCARLISIRGVKG